MTSPTDKHQATARAIRIPIPCIMESCRTGQSLCSTHLSIATALANTEADAFTAGRDEAKAEVVAMLEDRILKHVCKDYDPPEEGQQCGHIVTLKAIVVDIWRLAPSSGPTYEQRIREGIAERVKAVPTTRAVTDVMRVGGQEPRSIEQYRDDVLAAISKE